MRFLSVAICTLALLTGAHSATVSFDGSKVPNIVSNDLFAIQCAGKPSRLNRSSNGSANRQQTQCASPNRCSGTSLPSCDEYPYASSEQSSPSSVTRCVPAHENSVQGGTLSAFYTRSGVEDGDAYDVAFYNTDGLEYADGSCDNSGNEVSRRALEGVGYTRRWFKTSEGHELLSK